MLLAADASFTDNTPQLNISLGTDEQLQIVSNGSSYELSLTGGAWSGIDDANVSGKGTSTLTVSLSGETAFTSGIEIDDSGSSGGDAVVFADSGTNIYTNSFGIDLANAAATSMSFSGNTTFVGGTGLRPRSMGLAITACTWPRQRLHERGQRSVSTTCRISA